MQNAVDITTLTPEELAGMAEAGSEECFAELIRRYSDSLISFLQGKGSSREDAEELAQETFIRVHQNLHRYEPQYRFKTWLFTIAGRLLYSRHRKRNFDTVPIEEEVLPCEQTAENLWMADRKHNLWNRISGILPAAQLECLWLRYGKDFSIKEISGQTGRSRASVKVLLHRARLQLAEKLENERGIL